MKEVTIDVSEKMRAVMEEVLKGAKDRTEKEKILENFFSCETSKDAQMVRWGRTLKRWRS